LIRIILIQLYIYLMAFVFVFFVLVELQGFGVIVSYSMGIILVKYLVEKNYL